jgi:hypothetical protein
MAYTIRNRKPRGPSRKGIEGRLWEKVSPDPNCGCWFWTGATSSRRLGYGTIYANGRHQPAHRVSYELFVGPVPVGLELDHLCRVPCCVNPDHLEPVTHQENTRRGTAGKVAGALQQAKTHCPSGHPYTPENTYYRANGHRECRECSLGRSVEYQRWRRAQPKTPEELEAKRRYHRDWKRAKTARLRAEGSV